MAPLRHPGDHSASWSPSASRCSASWGSRRASSTSTTAKDETRAVKEIHDDAVVLRTYKSGEADRVVVLWTRHHGKVRVLAKGVRKSTSRLGAHARDARLREGRPREDPRRVLHRAPRRAPRAPRRRCAGRTRASRPATRSSRSMDAIPSDGVRRRGDLRSSDARAVDARRRDLRPDAGAGVVLLATARARRLRAGRRRRASTAGATCPLVAFDAEIGGTLCDDCRQGPRSRRRAGVCFAASSAATSRAVLREPSPPGAGEVMAPRPGGDRGPLRQAAARAALVGAACATAQRVG